MSIGRDNRDKAGGSAQITKETTSVKGFHLFLNRPADPPNYQPIIWNSVQFAGNKKIAFQPPTPHLIHLFITHVPVIYVSEKEPNAANEVTCSGEC